MSLELRPYQKEALEAIEKAAERGVRRPLLVLATGGGKTVCFAELIRRRGGRAMVLAHRDELLDQAAAKISAVCPGAWVGKIKAQHDDRMAPVVVASVQTLSRQSRLERLAPSYDTVIVDEAHHAPAESYRRILSHLGSGSEGGPLTLGVTATAFRGDEVGLGTVFDEIVFERGMLELIADGYLCDLRAKSIEMAIDWRELRTSRGDFVAGQAGEMMMDAHAPDLVARALLEHAPDRKGVVFTPTVQVSLACRDALNARGIAAEHIDGTTPADERAAILARLHSGETRIVSNCAVLTEGWDEPSIDVVVIARPTKSKTLFVQMVGRVTRRWPGKDDGLVIDVMGNARRHDLVSLPSLFGLPLDALEAGKKKRRGEADEGLTLTQAIAARGQPARYNGRLISVDVNLLQRKEGRWVGSAAGAYCMSVGSEGMLVLSPTLDGRVEILHEKRGEPAKVIDSADSLELASGIGEAHARRILGERGRSLIDPKAAWRDRPATGPQLEKLRKWRVPVPEGATAGQASDLISAKLAQFRDRRMAAGGR